MNGFNGSFRAFIHALHAALTGEFPVWNIIDHFNGSGRTIFYAYLALGTFITCKEGLCKQESTKNVISQCNWYYKNIERDIHPAPENPLSLQDLFGEADGYPFAASEN